MDVVFEHRHGWTSGEVSLPTGLRDKATIQDDGTFTVEVSDSEPLTSQPLFARLVEAGHQPVNENLSEETRDRIQQRFTVDEDGDGGDSGEENAGDGAEDEEEEREPDSLDEKDRSELYELAHNLDAVPEDEIPSWNECSADGLRDLIRHHVDEDWEPED